MFVRALFTYTSNGHPNMLWCSLQMYLTISAISEWSEWSGSSLTESTRITVCHEWKPAHWFFFLRQTYSNIVCRWENRDFFRPIKLLKIQLYLFIDVIERHTSDSIRPFRSSCRWNCCPISAYKYRYFSSIELDLSEIYFTTFQKGLEMVEYRLFGRRETRTKKKRTIEC